MKASSILGRPPLLFLLVIAGLATLLAGVVLVENWRGNRAWAAAENELRARGEPLDLAAFQTPPVPDDRNFFKAPLLDGLLYADNRDPNYKIRLAAATGSNPKSTSGRRKSSANNGTPKTEITITPGDPTGDLHRALAALLKSRLIPEPEVSVSASDILAAIKQPRPLLDAVRQAAAERPAAWLPTKLPSLDSKEPNLVSGLILDTGTSLGDRAKAELALGMRDEALADVVGVLGLERATKAGPPSIMDLLVSGSLRAIATLVLKDSCQRHSWTEPQLATLQHLIADDHAFVQLRKTLQFSRMYFIHYLDNPPAENPFVPAGQAQPWPRWLIRGWIQQNKVSASNWVDAQLETFDAASGQIFPDRLHALQKTYDALKQSESPYDWFTRHSTFEMSNIIEKLGNQENAVGEAVLACALERYRLAHGGYPVTLAELVPAFLAAVPDNVFTGQPIGYSRTPDGGFKLTAPDPLDPSKDKGWEQAGNP